MALPDRPTRRSGPGVATLLALLAGAACVGGPPPSRAADACPSGTAPVREGPRAWCATSEGVWEGPSWRRDAQGRLRAWGAGQDGLTEGPFWTFHANGRPASEAWFEGGELTGPYRAWDAEGTLRVEGRHDDEGRMHGRWRRYGPDGALRLAWTMRHGIHHGPTRGWHPDGTLRVQGRHEAGRREGPWTWWTPQGALQARCVYEAGRVVEGRCPDPPGRPGAARGR